MMTISRLVWLFVIALMVMGSFGCERRTKEQLLQEGLELQEEQNLTGAIVLFKNALEKDPNFFEARYHLGLTYMAGGQYARAKKEMEKVLLQDPDNIEVQLRLADVHIKTERYAEAIALMESLLREQGPSSAAYERLGSSFAAKGDLERAEQLFGKAIELDDQTLSARKGLAKVHIGSRRWVQARALLDGIVAQAPGDLEAHYLQMRLEALTGEAEAAIAVGRRILDLAPREIRAPYFLGLLELQRGDPQAVRQLAGDLLSQHPKHPAAVRLQGLADFAEGDYAGAVENLQRSLQQMVDPAGRYFLGLAHYKLEQFELALNQFQAILDGDPKHSKSRLMVAMTLFRQHRLDDSQAAAELVLATDAANPLAHDILGSIFMAQGDYDRGMKALDRAVELAPNLVNAHLKKGLFSLSKGQLEQAEAPLEEALRIAPELLNSRLLLAASHLQRQNYPQAIGTLKEGLRGKPADAVLLTYLAAAYWGHEQPEKAIAALEEAKRLKRDYFAPYVNLANYHMVKGQPVKAIAEYGAFLQIVPNHLQALLALATLQELQGDQQGTLASLQQARATEAVEGYLASARYFSRNGQGQQALEVIQEGAKLYPKHPTLLQWHGQLLLQLQRGADALTVFRMLAEEQPGRGLPMLLDALMHQGQTEEAEQLAQTQIRQQPSSSLGYLLLSALYGRQQAYAQAADVLQQGIAKVDQPIPLRMKLAEVYLAWQQPQRARTVYEAVRSSQPDYVPGIFALGALHDRLGDKRQAKTLYLAALEQDQNYVPALNNLAYLYADNYGNHKDALRLAAQALRQRPADAGIMDTLGYVLVRQERFKDALPYLLKAARLLPEEPEVQFHLALAYRGLDQSDEAVGCLEKVLGSSDSEQVQKARKLLEEMGQTG